MVSSADWSALPLLPHNQARVGVLDVIALALLENRSHAQRVAMAERLRQVLDDGLLMLGDSTTRVLYVQLCSVLNGGFSAEELSNKNARMKAEALAGTAFVSRCRVDQRGCVCGCTPADSDRCMLYALLWPLASDIPL